MTQSNPPTDSRRSIVRRCAACRNLFPREQLVRVVWNRMHHQVYLVQPSGESHISSGRSAYVCLSQSCLSTAVKGKKLQKALKTSVPDDILNYLLDYAKGIPSRGNP